MLPFHNVVGAELRVRKDGLLTNKILNNLLSLTKGQL